MNRVAFLGPIQVDLLDLECTWTSTPTEAGTRGASLRAYVPWGVAQQLSELVANPDRAVTIAGNTGVLEYVWAGDDMRRGFNGWYLFTGYSETGDYGASVDDNEVVSVTITAVNIGDNREVVVIRSDRARANAFALAGSAVLSAPFTVSDGNPAFVAEPGGTVVTRAFDAEHVAALFDDVADPRTMQLRVAGVGALPSIVLPSIEDDAQPPSWVSERGGDCRAYDLSLGRAVYGPNHPLAEPSDLVLENGLTRWWIGGRGIVPYVTVAAFAGGAWRQCGHVVLAAETSGPKLDSARLIDVTPDYVTAALRVRGQGDVFVTLCRGERMLRIQHGGTLQPAVTTLRRVGWAGLPPTTTGAAGLTTGDGEFGTGLDLGVSVPQFQWPVAATQEAWSLRGSIRPADAAADLDTAGLFSLLDSDNALVATGFFDAATNTLRVEIGAVGVSTPALVFGAGDVVEWVARFDTKAGLAITVVTPDATVHAADPTIVTPVGTKQIRKLVFYGAPEALRVAWGDGAWGDGTWGGAVLPIVGVIDELVVFAGRLTDAQADAVVDQTSQLVSIPSLPRAVWYAAFDTDPVPTAGALTSGRVVETTVDDVGFKRFAAALDAVADDVGGVAIRSSASVASIDLVVGLATTGTGDTAADMHNQFAAASEQETRIR